MADDIGKKLFSFTIDDSLDKKEYVRMGRAIQFRNSKKLIVLFMAALFLTFILSMSITIFFLIVFLAVVIEFVVYMEYASRNIASNIRLKLPISYDFYEDGLIEIEGEKSTLILYGKFSAVKMSNHLFTLVGRQNDIVVVPRCLIGRDSEKLLMKLQAIIGS